MNYPQVITQAVGPTGPSHHSGSPWVDSNPQGMMETWIFTDCDLLFYLFGDDYSLIPVQVSIYKYVKMYTLIHHNSSQFYW